MKHLLHIYYIHEQLNIHIFSYFVHGSVIQERFSAETMEIGVVLFYDSFLEFRLFIMFQKM